MLKQQRTIQQLNADVEEQKIEVELYKLEERISQIYLSILYIDEQLKQTQLIRDDLSTGIRKLKRRLQAELRSNQINLLKRVAEN
jgi:hypothetical protein